MFKIFVIVAVLMSMINETTSNNFPFCDGDEQPCDGKEVGGRRQGSCYDYATQFCFRSVSGGSVVCNDGEYLCGDQCHDKRDGRYCTEFWRFGVDIRCRKWEDGCLLNGKPQCYYRRQQTCHANVLCGLEEQPCGLDGTECCRGSFFTVFFRDMFQKIQASLRIPLV